jgi:hypothetical protein
VASAFLHFLCSLADGVNTVTHACLSTDPKCNAFTLDPDANWGGVCVGKTFCWTFASYTGTRTGSSSTFGSKGPPPPPPPPKPAAGASCVVQQDVFGTVSSHLSFKPIVTADDLHSCDMFNITSNGTFVGKNLGVFMDDTPANRNGVSGMPARRLPCLVARPEIPPLLAGPLQQWAKPQPKGSVAVFVVHNGQMESKAPHANQTVKIKFADVPWLDCSKTYAVRDLYAKQAAVPAQASGGSYEVAEALAPVSSRMFLFTPV